MKLENKVQEMVLKFETDSQRQHNNFQTHYGDIPPEFRKVSDTNKCKKVKDGTTHCSDFLLGVPLIYIQYS